MPADLRAEALALIIRLDSACHQDVDCAIYDHPYVAELREASQLAAAALAARLAAPPAASEPSEVAVDDLVRVAREWRDNPGDATLHAMLLQFAAACRRAPDPYHPDGSDAPIRDASGPSEECTGPNSSAWDCPVHRPRPAPEPTDEAVARELEALWLRDDPAAYRMQLAIDTVRAVNAARERARKKEGT